MMQDEQGATAAGHEILGARNQLAGHSPNGNRRGSVGVGGQFLDRKCSLGLARRKPFPMDEPVYH